MSYAVPTRLQAHLAASVLAAALALHVVTAAAQSGEPARANIGDLAWLAGNWTGGSAGTTLEERWTTPAGGAMLAVSRTVKDGKMVGFEFLRIVERNGTLVYVAQPGGRPPTDFTLTAKGEGSATFENPSHDFPKRIQYARRGNSLEATVSDGGSKKETFAFTLATR